MQKTLTRMNFHLYHVISDLIDTIGLAAMDGILDGDCAPQT